MPQQSNSNKPGPIAWAVDRRSLDDFLEAIAQSSEVVMDLETTGLDEHAVTGGVSNGGVAARVSLAAFTLPQRADVGDYSSGWDGAEPTTWIVPLSHPNSPLLGAWRRVLGEAARQIVKHDRPLVNQHVKFDAKWIEATTGVDLSRQIVWDTQVSAHLLDENASTALKERAPETFGIPRWDDHDLSYPGASEDVPLFELGEYAARDTYWTWRLYRAHRLEMFLPYGDGAETEPPFGGDEVRAARLGTLATWVAMPTVASLTIIEQNGFRLDRSWVEHELRRDETAASEGLIALAEKYDLDPSRASAASTSGWFVELTQRAIEAGDLVIGALTPSGAPQWSKSVLGRQARNGSETARMILEQRQASKRAEYLRSWLEFLAPDGAIHATYWPGRVVTGRLSSTEPNMQQITRSLRPAFIPREGYVIADFDYSQIELRVAASISGCGPMIDAFRRGDDLHSLLAAKIAGKSIEDVTKEERQKGKSANFGLLYGMGAAGFQSYAEDAYGVIVTMEESEALREGFFDLWDGLRQWHQRQVGLAHRDGFVTSPLGRVRRLPGIWDGNPHLVGEAERRAINSPVQGMASDLLMMSAASIQGVLPGHDPVEGVRLVATVHDSIVAELPADDWERAAREVQERMTSLDRELARMGVEFAVPLVADATVGTRWGLGDISES